MASLSELSLVRSEVSIMRLPTLTMRPPISAGSTFGSSVTSLPSDAFSAAFSAATCASESGSALVTSAADLAALLGGEPLERGDHRRERRTGGGWPATTLTKLATRPADAGPVEDGGDARGSVVSGEDRAAHEPPQVGAFGDQGGEAVEVGFDVGKRLLSSASSNSALA